MRSASIGLMIVSFGVFVMLVLPLVGFFSELLTNPSMFLLEYSILPVDNGYNVTFELGYNGSVVLKDFRVELHFGNKTYFSQKDSLEKGDSITLTVFVPKNITTKISVDYSMRFKIAGIYGFSLGVRGGS